MISLSDLQPGVVPPPPPVTASYAYTQPIIAPPPPATLQAMPELEVPPRQGRNKEETYIRMLCEDPAFVHAVQSGDSHTAARCSWKFYQHHVVSLLRSVQEEREQGAQYQRDLEYYQPPHRSNKARYRDDEDSRGHQKELRPGDWVVIQDVKQRNRDGDLVGHHAQVQSLDATGQWVELTVPKLGCTARLQARYLAPLSMAVAGPRTSSGYPTSSAEPHSLVLTGHGYKHKDARRHAASAGDASPDTDDTSSLRIGRRHHFEGYVRPLTIGQPLPPAKVGPLLGRGVSKARDVCRHVRREMLSLEEVVPWECVEHSWKMRRGAWRKGLKGVDTNKQPIESLVTSVATSLLELHLALLTDKNNAHNTLTGVLVKGGAWDTRVQELVAGGNNYQCLQAVWEELHEVVRAWLHHQGHALPPASNTPQGTPASLHHHHHHHHLHHHTPGGGMLSPGPPMPPPPSSFSPASSMPPIVRSFDSASFTAVLKAINMLQAGNPVTCSDLTIGQVAADRVITLGREASSALRTIVMGAEEMNLGASLETVAGACELHALLGITQGELDRLGDADVLCLMLVSPAVRAELKMMHNVDSEPDTDVDVAGDMTDMDLSD